MRIRIWRTIPTRVQAESDTENTALKENNSLYIQVTENFNFLMGEAV